MKHDAAIAHKLGQVREDVAAMEAGERVRLRIGGATLKLENRDKTFQQRRVGWLEWAQVEPESAIRERMQVLWDAMDDDERIVMASGNMKLLPEDVIDRIAEYELLLLALGEHPGQRR